jgi:hypothetical protein
LAGAALGALFVLSLGGALSCSGGDGGSEGGGDGRHHDPVGFSLVLPDGYAASFEKGAYIKVESDDKKTRGVVFPFLAPEAMSAEACLAKAPAAFTELMPGARLESSKQAKTQPDEATGRFAHTGGVANGLCSIDARSGVLFLAIVPKETEQESTTTLVQVFQTLRFEEPDTQAGAQLDGSGIPSKDWEEPNEKAFTTKVPADWKVEGGLFRLASVDVRVHLRLVSPDEKITVAIGDKELPPFATPMAGFPEGSTYNPGYGVDFYVKSFTTGGNFAAQYADAAAPKVGCPGVTSTPHELEDLTRRMQAEADRNATPGIRVVNSAGEAKFDCEGGSRIGHIVSTTSLTTQSEDGSGTWTVGVLVGFVAPKERADEARSVVSLVYGNYKPNAEWVRAQQGTTAATAQIVSSTSNEIAAIYSGSTAQTQQTMDEVYRDWSNAALGQTDVVDPTTGETYKIASGKNYYWRKAGTDVGAGTDTYERPDIDFTPLTEY